MLPAGILRTQVLLLSPLSDQTSGGDGSLQGSLKQERGASNWGGLLSPPAPEQVPVKPTGADPGLSSDLALSGLHPACSSRFQISFLIQTTQWHLLVGLDMWVQTPPVWGHLCCLQPQGHWEANKHLLRPS